MLSITDKQDKISIWMKHGNEVEIKERVKQDLIRICELPSDIRLDFLLFFPPNKQKDEKKYAERELKPVVL